MHMHDRRNRIHLFNYMFQYRCDSRVRLSAFVDVIHEASRLVDRVVDEIPALPNPRVQTNVFNGDRRNPVYVLFVWRTVNDKLCILFNAGIPGYEWWGVSTDESGNLVTTKTYKVRYTENPFTQEFIHYASRVAHTNEIRDRLINSLIRHVDA